MTGPRAAGDPDDTGAAADAERWLLALENAGIRPGLARTRALLVALGLDPAATTPATVHVAGTNGKSSTTLLCAAMLRRAGLSAGAYVSPHVESFADRVRLDDGPLDPDAFAAHVAGVRAAVAGLDEAPGQFEALTAVALRAFAAAGVDVQVLEAGLGGRLDATNAIRTDVQVLTSVGLDHQAWLGDSLEEIALEKLAIVEEGGVLVVGPALTPTVAVLAEGFARERGAEVVRAEAVPPSAVPDPAAAGGYQLANLGIALAATRALLGRLGGPVTPVADAELVAAGAAILPLRGRLDPVATDPLVLVDAAHNVEAARALAAALPGVTRGRRVVLVAAFLDDKDPVGVLRALRAQVSEVVATPTASPRSLPASAVADAASRLGLGAREAPDVAAAVGLAREAAGRDGVVLVTGTTTLARELAAPGAASNASRF